MNRNKKTITFGDRIFARVTRNGQTIYNFMSEKVASMTDLLSQLRIAMKDIQGLVMLHIRNYNQGWGDQRPLMLYTSKTRNYPEFNESVVSAPMELSSREMFFPWETH